jgi:HK97 family phage prohead protease
VGYSAPPPHYVGPQGSLAERLLSKPALWGWRAFRGRELCEWPFEVDPYTGRESLLSMLKRRQLALVSSAAPLNQSYARHHQPFTTARAHPRAQPRAPARGREEAMPKTAAAAKQQITPEDDEDYSDFMDRCMEDEDAEECRLIWADNRSKIKTNGGKVVRKEHAEPAVNMEFVLSDETVDRMNDIVMSTGWVLDDFLKNPIALFNHNSNFPIGTWSDVAVKNGQLRGRLNLLKEGKSARVDEIRALIEAGILKATSVGFAPLEHEPMKSGDPFGGSRYKRQALVETSVVSVPANPNAISLAKSLKISDDTFKLAFAKTGSRGAHEVGRRLTGKPAETSRIESKSMSLAQRITDSQSRIVVLRDKLTEHLKAVDDSNVSDGELEMTQDFNAKIEQEEKGLAVPQGLRKALLANDDRQPRQRRHQRQRRRSA